MLEFIFSAPFIVGLIVGIVGGAYLGVLMSRRSADANRIADTIRAGDFEAFRNEMRREFAEMRAKLRAQPED